MPARTWSRHDSFRHAQVKARAVERRRGVRAEEIEQLEVELLQSQLVRQEPEQNDRSGHAPVELERQTGRHGWTVSFHGCATDVRAAGCDQLADRMFVDVEAAVLVVSHAARHPEL